MKVTICRLKKIVFLFDGIDFNVKSYNSEQKTLFKTE